jgi:hypothetical protein
VRVWFLLLRGGHGERGVGSLCRGRRGTVWFGGLCVCIWMMEAFWIGEGMLQICFLVGIERGACLVLKGLRVKSGGVAA